MEKIILKPIINCISNIEDLIKSEEKLRGDQIFLNEKFIKELIKDPTIRSQASMGLSKKVYLHFKDTECLLTFNSLKQSNDNYITIHPNKYSQVNNKKKKTEIELGYFKKI